jgi:hypothetical protein
MALKRPEGLEIDEKNYAYVMSTREGLEVLDVSNPAEPRHITAIFDNDELALGGLDGLDIKENYLYLVGKEGFAIFDISEPSNPRQISAISPAEEKGLAVSNDIKLSGNYAFVISEGEEGSLVMIDISDPKNPLVKSVLYTDDSKPFLRGGHHLEIIGNYIYITGLQDGIGIVKFSE